MPTNPLRKSKPKKTDNIVLRETEIHLSAFKYYLGMGAARSLAKLQKEYGKWKVNGSKKEGYGIDALEKWSFSFGWQNRVEEFEKESRKRELRKMAKEFFKKRSNIIALKHSALFILNRKAKNAIRKKDDVLFSDLSVREAREIWQVSRMELGETTHNVGVHTAKEMTAEDFEREQAAAHNPTGISVPIPPELEEMESLDGEESFLEGDDDQ